MEKLPAYFDVAMRAHGEKLSVKIREVEDAWRRALERSQCASPGNEWQGQIDGPLRKFLTKLTEFFSWLAEHMPRRKEEVSATLRTIDPANRQLPKQIEKLNVDTWDQMREFFQSVAHHGRVISREEFDQWSDALERFLLERLVPRTFDDFAKIDAILSGRVTNA